MIMTLCTERVKEERGEVKLLLATGGVLIRREIKIIAAHAIAHYTQLEESWKDTIAAGKQPSSPSKK